MAHTIRIKGTNGGKVQLMNQQLLQIYVISFIMYYTFQNIWTKKIVSV